MSAQSITANKRALISYSFRHYVGIFREDYLINRLEQILKNVRSQGFELLSVEPRMKDGGVFVKFKYNAIEQDKALGEILSEVKTVCSEKGGTPTWTGMSSIAGEAWAVKGQPWREVSSQYFS